jgi:hypothetical protein
MRLALVLICVAACGNISRRGDDNGDATLAIDMVTRDFGALTIGGAGSAPATFVITNNGSRPTGPLASSIGGSGATFMISSDGCGGQSLTAGASCSVSVVFMASSAGAQNATLTVSGNPGGSISANLSGLGLTPGNLTITPTTYDFGMAVQGTPSTPTTFVVKNTGGASASSITTALTGTNAGDFEITTNDCTGMTLASQATCTISARLAVGSPGDKSATLSVTSSAGSVVATLSGIGLSPGNLSISPSSRDFAPRQLNTTSAAQSFTITNLGGSATGTLATSLSGSGASNFAINSDNCNTTTLAASGSCTVSVTFTPTAAGSTSATLIVTGAPGGSVSGALTGSGLAPANLTATPSQHDFGQVVTNNNSTVSIQINNTGGVASGTVSTSIGGTDTSQFAIVTPNACAGVAIAPGGSCTLQVRFTPTSSGNKSASLNISASPGGTPSVSLQGIGLAPGNLTITPTNSNFNGVLTGSTSNPATFTVQNIGGVSVGPLGTVLQGSNANEFAITNDQCANMTLSPNGTCTLQVVFTPTTTGGKNASVVVSAGTTSTAASLSGVGQAQASLAANFATLNFGSIVNGSTSDLTVTISNSGDVPTGTLSTTRTGDSSYSIVTNTCTGTLAGKGTCSITVRFAPVSAGSKTGMMVISGTPGGSATVNFTGTGQTPAALSLTGSASFPDTAIGSSSSAQTYTVQNTGEQTSGPITLTVTGTNASNFTIVGGASDTCSGSSLVSTQTCSFTVTFVASGSTGSKTATLNANATPGSLATLAVSGTATTAPSLSLTGPGTPYGSVVVGQSVDRDFTVTNSGSLPTGTLSVTITGTDASMFSRVTAPINDCPAGSLAGSSNCTIRIRFAPTSRLAKTAQLNVSATPGGTPNAALSGTGIAPILTSSLGMTYTFANQVSGTTSAALTWTITNTGDATSAVPSVTESGANQADFTHSTTCTAALAPNATCNVVVTFTPSALGTRTSTFTVTAGTQSVSVQFLGNGVYRLTVSVTGTGTGSVSSSDGVINACTGTCTGDYTTAATVNLTATTTNGSNAYFEDWTSPTCDGPAKTCSEVMGSNKTVTATFGSYATSGNLMFVTSTLHAPGGLGTTGGDTECNTRASAAGINNANGNLYMAWQSMSANDAKTRLTVSYRGWKRLDGSILADDQTSMLSSTSPRFLNPVRYDENGTVITQNRGYVTGTTSAGTYSGNNCTNWSSTSGYSNAGDVTEGAVGWTDQGQFDNIFCNSTTSRLLCVMKRNNVALSIPTPPTGSKRIVLTTNGHTPGAGVTPNDRCVTEAGAGYVALVGYIGVTWGSLVNDTTVYRRPDGVVIGTGAQLKNQSFSSPLPSGFFQRGDGTYINNGGTTLASPWVGPPSSSQAGTSTSTCNDWATGTSSGWTAYVGDPLSSLSWMFGNGYSGSCALSRPLFCIEQ